MALQGRLLLPILLFALAWRSSFASGQKGHVCISQGGRFPAFSLEGKPPRKSSKGPDDLTLCRIYRKRTCCTAAQTHPALLSIRKLASSGEGSNECLLFWEAMECALCDPLVGTMQGPPKLCKSFCESALDACQNAFFSFDAMNQVLLPCGPKDIICAQASKWATNGSHFCELAGYVVPSSKDIIESGCFDGRQSVDTDVPTSRNPETKNTYRKKRSLRQLLRYFTTQFSKGDLVIWLVGGLVLTAGVLLMRRRNLSSQRKKEAMLRLVREASSKHQAALTTKEKNARKRT